VSRETALYDLVRTLQDAGEEVVLSTQQAEHIERGPVPPNEEQLPPYRFIDNGDGIVSPASGLIIRGDSIERWTPVIRSWHKGEALGALPTTMGWEVRSSKLEINDRYCSCVGTRKFVDGVHDLCGRPSDPTRVYWDHEHGKPQTFGAHVRGINIGATSDFDYDAFYPTLKGNDLIHFDLNKPGMEAWREGSQKYSRADNLDNPQYAGPSIPLRGGKEITGGRREYRQVMKEQGMIHVDDGYWKDVERAKVEREAKADERLNDIAEQAAADLPHRMGEL
jgi:hypothetical protein